MQEVPEATSTTMQHGAVEPLESQEFRPKQKGRGPASLFVAFLLLELAGIGYYARCAIKLSN